MKITKIRIRNFLGIADFVSDDLGRFNRIEGTNGAGKSTITTAIRDALKAGGYTANCIKIGEDQAEIHIEIDDNITVDRIISEGGGDKRKVVVDGSQVASPVAFLKKIMGPTSIDPTAFFEAKPRPRRQMLLSAIDFKITQSELTEALGDDASMLNLGAFDYENHGLLLLDLVQSEVYSKRAEQNRDVIRLTKAIEQDKIEIPSTFDVEKFKGFDLSVRISELEEANAQISDYHADLKRLEDLRTLKTTIQSGIDGGKQKIESLRAEIVKWENEVSKNEKRYEKTVDDGKALRKKTDAFVSPDSSALKAEIAEYNESQGIVQKLKLIEQREGDLEKDVTLHAQLDALHKRLVDDIRSSLMSKVDLPIEGLAIDGDKITVNGVSIDRLSDGEQIEFSCEIARALAKGVKAILIDGFERLAPGNRKLFEEETDGDGFQYFTAIATDGELRVKSSD